MAAMTQEDTRKFVVISLGFPIPNLFLFPGVLGGKMRNQSLGRKLQWAATQNNLMVAKAQEDTCSNYSRLFNFPTFFIPQGLGGKNEEAESRWQTSMSCYSEQPQPYVRIAAKAQEDSNHKIVVTD